jgi:hypothetical protein
MLMVANKPVMLRVLMINVVMLSAVILNVIYPKSQIMNSVANTPIMLSV